MAALIINYSGLVSALATWLLRDGDAVITSRADDYIALCEQRMYLGGQAIASLGIPEMEAIRIPEMYTLDSSFSLAKSVDAPTGILELVEAKLNTTNTPPLTIVEESILDQMGDSNCDPLYIALSGNKFRVWPASDDGTYDATIRYYARLTTPSGSNATNWVLTNAPGVYLNGCLLEAALSTGDFESAARYAVLYSSAANSLNTSAQRRLASGQNVRLKVRGMTP